MKESQANEKQKIKKNIQIIVHIIMLLLLFFKNLFGIYYIEDIDDIPIYVFLN